MRSKIVQKRSHRRFWVDRNEQMQLRGKYTKVHLFLLFNVKETVVDNVVYYLSIVASIPEIFAVKVESCPKSQRILNVFCLPKF